MFITIEHLISEVFLLSTTHCILIMSYLCQTHLRLVEVWRLGCFQTRGRFPFQKTAIMVSQYNGLRTQQDIDHTLIHEMIHLWQWNNHHKLGHGQSFKNKSWDIHLKSKGVFNITRCRKVGLEATATAKDLPQPKSCISYLCISSTR